MKVNGKEHILTLEETIRGHREMWRWIDEQIKSGNFNDRDSGRDRWILKKKWVDEHKITDLKNNCFACEFAWSVKQLFAPGYVRNNSISKCHFCPFQWYKKEASKITGCKWHMVMCELHCGDNVNWLVSDPIEVAKIPLAPDAIKALKLAYGIDNLYMIDAGPKLKDEYMLGILSESVQRGDAK